MEFMSPLLIAPFEKFYGICTEYCYWCIGEHIVKKMRTSSLMYILLLSISLIPMVYAEGEPNAEYLDRVPVNYELSPHGSNLLGDTIDLASGSLAFSHLDAHIPGNFPLEVAIRRSYGKTYAAGRVQFAFGDWNIDTPHIRSQVYHSTAGSAETDFFDGPWVGNDECTSDDNFQVVPGYKPPQAYWNGLTLNIPGKNKDEILQNTLATGADGYSTRSNWTVECFNRLNSGGGKIGEGFLATSPEGMQYTFDKKSFIYIRRLVPGGKTAIVVRAYQAYMYASRVEDKFGNWVNYSYQTYTGDTFNHELTPRKLTSIVSSDGRRIDINYLTSDSNVVDNIVVNNRIWKYRYDANGNLNKVIRPDGSQWIIDLSDLDINRYSGDSGDGCRDLSTAENTVTLTHPNGMTGTFKVGEIRHGRTNVEYFDTENPPGELFYKKCYFTTSITEKRLVGPGVQAQTWLYTYSQNKGAFEGEAKPTISGLVAPLGYDAGDLKRTTVRSPDGSKIKYYFSRKWDFTENQKVMIEYFDVNGSTKIRQKENFYAKGNRVGYILGAWDNPGSDEFYVNKTKEIIRDYKDGGEDSFTTQYSDFNIYAVPTKISEFNSFSNDKRYTKYSFIHDSTNWVLNMPDQKQLSSDNSSYKTTTNLDYKIFLNKKVIDKEYSNGLLIKTIESYHADGNPKRINFNSTGSWIELGDYKRGVPQLLKQPDRYDAGEIVNSNQIIDYYGNATSRTDWNGNITGYNYDDLNKLVSIDIADADFSDTNIVYRDRRASDPTDFNGSLVQEITRGNFQEIRYYDSLLRMVLVENKDVSNQDETRVFQS
tara:strand:- start:4727 stop:7183 length:2457 start_codon:yes stop_codon:yes gene_type:complete